MMNLINGQCYTHEDSLNLLQTLEEAILDTKQHTDAQQIPELLIYACEQLLNVMELDVFIDLLIARGMTQEKALRELMDVQVVLSRYYLEARLAHELTPQRDTWTYQPIDLPHTVTHSWKPLGALLHLCAGNVDALPAFSVIEGLLTGNINILKLPTEEDGLSLYLLQRLIDIEPRLAPYIYVFNYPSTEIQLIQKLVEACDAIVVWGSDQAITAIRQLAPPHVQLIEWGHKISFAYIDNPDTVTDSDLNGLAFNIVDTQQLLCSACQGIYINSNSTEVLHQFAQRFYNILTHNIAPEKEHRTKTLPLTIRAQKAIEIHTERLEAATTPKKIYSDDHCSVIAYPDRALQVSYQFANTWVKRLPEGDILKTLSPHKNHLQTLALYCEPPKRKELENLFFKTGIVRITRGETMSKSYCGMPHDGHYPLRRYMKLVSTQTLTG